MAEYIRVSALNALARRVLETCDPLNNLIVCGEISNFTRHSKSGHLYFTLKDEQSSVKTVMFRDKARLLGFAPQNGMLVLVYGRATLYERDGAFQVYAEYMRPFGAGAAQMAFDALRKKLMPIDQAYDMDTLMEALRHYSEGNHRRLTFEYILLHGVNDSDENAIELADRIRGMNAYVNLIPYNQVDENGYRSTDAKTALHFYDVLMKHGVKATLRTRHGEDIDAACGQLRAKHEKEKDGR